MGCNCKKKVNEKYTEKEIFSEVNVERVNVLSKMGNMVAQFFFGILIALIMIIGLIPACIYIMFCVCTGTPMKARIPDFGKWIKK